MYGAGTAFREIEIKETAGQQSANMTLRLAAAWRMELTKITGISAWRSAHLSE